MNTLAAGENRRILVVDDNAAVQRDYQKILLGPDPALATDATESTLFGAKSTGSRRPRFEVTCASQGAEGLELMDRAASEGRPFALAFVDLRMPPGWDGVETAERIWRRHPDLEVVICTAFSDYTWQEIIERLGYSERLVILKKPFDNVEVLQLATALTEKWQLRLQAGARLADLEALVAERTRKLHTARDATEKANAQLKAEIAERHHAEEAALQWQQRHEIITSASGQVIYDHDLCNGEVVWSGSVEKVLGLNPQQLGPGPSSWTALIHRDDLAEATRLLFEAELGETACERTYRLKCGNGEYRWMHDRSFLLVDGARQSRRRLGIMEDITERRWAEQHIREQASLLNQTQDAILVCDLDYCVRYWNRAAEQLYGWSESEALRQKVPDLLHRQTSLPFRTACLATIATGAWTGELTPTCRDGRCVTVESRWTLLRDPAGVAMSLLIVNTDVTARKQLEGRFLRAQRLDGIGKLASGIAHDLNNVFTPILMAGQMLKDKVGGPEVNSLFAILQNSAKRGAAMVRQVLIFARGADGERITLKLSLLLEEIDALIRDTFPRAIELRSNLDDSLYPVRANATQLHQVLMNVCVNARDAMPDGGVLTFTAQNLLIDGAAASRYPNARPGPYVLVTVSDTGTGMSPEVMDHVFEPFFTTKPSDQGSGLGLATTLGIVQSHGGFIDLESTPGKGTHFHIYLPASTEIQEQPRTSKEPFIPAGQGDEVLVVDDETYILDVTQVALEAHGYRVAVAGDGVEAMKIFKADPTRFRLIITDMMMPHMDGQTMIQAIRELNPTVPVILVSGLVGDKSGLRPSVTAGTTLLRKPYTPGRLLETVCTVLNRSAPR